MTLGFKDTTLRTKIEKARASMAELPTNVSVLNCLGNTAGEALNTLVAAQTCVQWGV